MEKSVGDFSLPGLNFNIINIEFAVYNRHKICLIKFYYYQIIY
jgi:hypothetical protein